MGLANADDGNGTTCSRACSQHGTVCEERRRRRYQGDNSHQLLQVDVARQMESGNTGAEVFMSVTTNAGYVLMAMPATPVPPRMGRSPFRIRPTRSMARR
jgi:flagellar hook-associated protein 3 FlgL